MQAIERQEAVTPSTITGGGVHFSAAAMRALVRYAGRAGVTTSTAWLAASLAVLDHAGSLEGGTVSVEAVARAVAAVEGGNHEPVAKVSADLMELMAEAE